jgi:hypothetical protein
MSPRVVDREGEGEAILCLFWNSTEASRVEEQTTEFSSFASIPLRIENNEERVSSEKEEKPSFPTCQI